MRSIQDIGSEILNDTPKAFYIFGGTEYGIKKKYLSILSKHYNDDVVDGSTMKELIGMMSVKRIIPLAPKLYIVRYDEGFITDLNESLANKIKSLNIIGTIVCLYESDKHITKLDKFLGDYLVRIDNVSTQFKVKYLHSDFPKLPDRLINLAAQYGDNYGDAQNICVCMSQVPPEDLFALSDVDMMKLFGKSDTVSEDAIKLGIASRNFKYLVNLLDNYSDLESVYYTILATMLELEKVITSKYAESSLREYAKRWTEQNVYNMFMNTYEALKRSRSSLSADTKNTLLYLFSLLKFEVIPSFESMEV